MSRIIGIDLGTTNSCVVVMEGGDPLVLPNSEGARTTPSIVAFTKNGDRLVGQQAKRQAVINPTRTVSGIKRLIGRRIRDPEIGELQRILPYQLTGSPQGDCWVEIEGQLYSPQEISGLILQKMKATAEDYFGEEITEAVITVPAYFDDAQRQATRDAGQIAGLDVKRIINEPTAAALAFGQTRREKGTLAIFDLGGGTFDISIVSLMGGVFEVLATSGDNTLGGEDFDFVIMEHLLQKFEAENGLSIANDSMAIQRLKEAAEAAKCELSTLSETNINLPFLAVHEKNGPMHLNYSLTRSTVNDLCADLIARLDAPCLEAVRDAELSMKDIDEVLLVGGMTRMPLVRERVESIFGKRPSRSVNPDEVVAMGAAVQSGILGGEVQEVVLMDVTPLKLGIRIMGDRVSTVIKKNSPVPLSVSKQFTTTEDNQTFVSLTIVQGQSSKASENRMLGTFRLSNIPPQPAGVPRIEVSFNINTDGIVNVSARDLATGIEQTILVRHHGGMTNSARREAAERVSHH